MLESWLAASADLVFRQKVGILALLWLVESRPSVSLRRVSLAMFSHDAFKFLVLIDIEWFGFDEVLNFLLFRIDVLHLLTLGFLCGFHAESYRVCLVEVVDQIGVVWQHALELELLLKLNIFKQFSLLYGLLLRKLLLVSGVSKQQNFVLLASFTTLKSRQSNIHLLVLLVSRYLHWQQSFTLWHIAKRLMLIWEISKSGHVSLVRRFIIHMGLSNCHVS